MSGKEEKPKRNKKINKWSRKQLKKKARELLESGQIHSKYYRHILAQLEGRPRIQVDQS